MEATNGTVLLEQKLSKKVMNTQYDAGCAIEKVLEGSI